MAVKLKELTERTDIPERVLETIQHHAIMRCIEHLRSEVENAPHIFTNGKCFEFCDIMKYVFPEGEIWYDSDHAIFKLGDRFYDINGQTKKGRHIPIEEHQELCYKAPHKIHEWVMPPDSFDKPYCKYCYKES